MRHLTRRGPVSPVICELKSPSRIRSAEYLKTSCSLQSFCLVAGSILLVKQSKAATLSGLRLGISTLKLCWTVFWCLSLRTNTNFFSSLSYSSLNLAGHPSLISEAWSMWIHHFNFLGPTWWTLTIVDWEELRFWRWSNHVSITTSLSMWTHLVAHEESGQWKVFPMSRCFSSGSSLSSLHHLPLTTIGEHSAGTLSFLLTKSVL